MPEPIILYAKECADEVLEDVKAHVELFTNSPHFAIIKVGDNPASEVYARHKESDARKCGIVVSRYSYPDNRKDYTDRIIKLITELNMDASVCGIMVQLPLPVQYTIDKHFKIIESISPHKDVDGLTRYNAGMLYTNAPKGEYLKPCTPYGIMTLLEHYHLDDVYGHNVVVIGQSPIVGKPIAQMMLQNHATVTVCHSATRNLKEYTKCADIIITAVGERNFITPDMIPDDRCFGIIDVGINRDDSGNLCGDCHPDVYKQSMWYTPVPGGVGLMTRAMLMRNVIHAAYDVKKMEDTKANR